MKSLALGAIVASTVLLATAYALSFLPDAAPILAPALLAIGTGVLASTLMLAAERNGKLGVLWVPITFILVIVAGGLVALLLLPATDVADPTLFFGLPPRAALLMYGVGLLPTLVVPVAYALTFDSLTLRPGDLGQVRDAGRRRKERLSSTGADISDQGSGSDDRAEHEGSPSDKGGA